MIEHLRAVDLFDELDDACVARLAEASHEEEVAAGTWFIREGEPTDSFRVLTAGVVEWQKDVGGEAVTLVSRSAPTYFGAMNLLTEEPSAASGRAVVDSRVIVVPGEAFRRLLRDEPSVLRGALGLIAPTFQGAEAALREREKLIALGTMSAGLAHELNNPAAAARRSAEELGRALEVLEQTLRRFVECGVEREAAERLVALQQEAVASAAARGPADALDDADREDALVDLLDERGLEGWRLAPPIADAGLGPDWVARVGAEAGTALGPALEWVAASLTARGLVDELHESTRRISAIVGAVRDYTHMDRASVQTVDVHDGLESTLTMLAHPLKRGDVRVERDYDRGLPPVTVHASQMNQVWTNLIHNAIDAVDGAGVITIRTGRLGDELVVEVADDGPGIPPELAGRVFDPFFTTKDVGAGTGLGLDIVRRIVANHRGSVQVSSEPGDTRFTVRLPLG
jgi:signal transduction histidine kinase